MIADGKMDVQLDVPKASRVSRLEVIEGPTGRRNRSAAEKAKIAARFLQCDGYEGYGRLTRIERPQGPWVLVHCWSHLRRRFVKLVRSNKSPIAEAAVRQIATLYAVEAMVRGSPR